jgi:hypothetical protein
MSFFIVVTVFIVVFLVITAIVVIVIGVLEAIPSLRNPHAHGHARARCYDPLAAVP